MQASLIFNKLSIKFGAEYKELDCSLSYNLRIVVSVIKKYEGFNSLGSLRCPWNHLNRGPELIQLGEKKEILAIFHVICLRALILAG